MSTQIQPNHHTHVNVMENGRLVWKPKSWLEDLRKQEEEIPAAANEPASDLKQANDDLASSHEQLPLSTEGEEKGEGEGEETQSAPAEGTPAPEAGSEGSSEGDALTPAEPDAVNDEDTEIV